MKKAKSCLEFVSSPRYQLGEFGGGCLADNSMRYFPSFGTKVRATDCYLACIIKTFSTDRFAADCDPSLSEKVLDNAVARIESKVEPDDMRNNVRWELETFIGSHTPMLSIPGSLVGCADVRALCR